MKKIKEKLLIPGPVEVADDVLGSMGRPVLAHYGSQWTAFYNETVSYLKQIFNTSGDVFILVGSGTAGVDACIGSAFSVGEKILIGLNGFFGDRLKSIAESHGLQVIPVEVPWGEPLIPEAFEKGLKENPDAKGIAVVHLETSTGVVNPIREIGEIAKAHKVAYAVDAVSSLGGLPFDMDECHIDFCASCSQKCLGAPPGLAPVAVSDFGWEVIDRKKQHHAGWYLNLKIWKQYAVEWGDWHPSPVTMATSNVAALNASLKSLITEGLAHRIERYKNLAARLREGLPKIGFPLYLPENLMASTLTPAYGPAGIATGEIVAYLFEKYGIRIAGGLGLLHNKIIRIGHMSPRITPNDIYFVIDALAEYARKHQK